MLEQTQADHFIKLKKRKVTDDVYDLSQSKIQIPLIGATHETEEFILDINKNIIRIDKYTFQNRVRKSVGLIRVDFGASGGHTNPDGVVIVGPHIHIYKEGFELKWAYRLPYVGPYGSFVDKGSLFSNINQIYGICNIQDPPNLQGGFI